MQITTVTSAAASYYAFFNDLMGDVYSISFDSWHRNGGWGADYESHSIIEDGKMLANLSITKIDLLLGGKTVRAHQIGAVATRECARGRGLSRRLMEHIFALYPDVPAFLFANQTVLEFYPRFGFRQVQMSRTEIELSINNPPTMAVRLTPDEAIAALDRRRVFSGVIDCTNTRSIQMFHLLGEFSDCAYRLPNCGAVVVAQQEGARLFIADIIAESPINFTEIAKELPFSGVTNVAFWFTPDAFGVEPNWKPLDMKAVPFFVRGDLELPRHFHYPATSET